MPPTLILGTHNQKKRSELAALVAPLSIQVRTLADYPQALCVEEDGHSFAENARKKACQQAAHLRAWVLGEDSGLVVDALRGAPGVFSARYSGPDATDGDNNRRLLTDLGETPLARRTAHYACYAVLANPAGEPVVESQGTCHGRILFEPRGAGGFGYDPLFEVVEYHRTFAELGSSVKLCLSHRARAMRRLLPKIATALECSTLPADDAER